MKNPFILQENSPYVEFYLWQPQKSSLLHYVCRDVINGKVPSTDLILHMVRVKKPK